MSAAKDFTSQTQAPQLVWIAFLESTKINVEKTNASTVQLVNLPVPSMQKHVNCPKMDLLRVLPKLDKLPLLLVGGPIVRVKEPTKYAVGRFVVLLARTK